MPTSPSAGKRVRQNLKRRARNRTVKSKVKTQISKLLAALQSGEVEASRREFRLAVQAIDKAVGKGVLHRNTAARRKSRLAATLNRLASPAQEG
jgi:small subunit ribosomal protein S20